MHCCSFYTDEAGYGEGTLPLLRCSLLSAAHGFSCRIGGISTPAHLSSLNLGYGVGDSEDDVRINRSRFFSAVASHPLQDNDAVWAHQIHSATVRCVGRKDLGRDDLSLDGFVTRESGVLLFIRTADCCPLLFCDAENGVIGACHAGWRGSVADIAGETVRAMMQIGADVRHIRCAIGPCIHSCCYEVGDDFVETLCTSLSPDITKQALQRYPDGRYHADLTEINRMLLIRSGMAPEHIAIAPDCTCCQPGRYFSHRASGGRRGLMGSGITL